LRSETGRVRSRSSRNDRDRAPMGFPDSLLQDQSDQPVDRLIHQVEGGGQDEQVERITGRGDQRRGDDHDQERPTSARRKLLGGDYPCGSGSEEEYRIEKGDPDREEKSEDERVVLADPEVVVDVGEDSEEELES